MPIIGLTGSIGSGKSEVSKILSDLNCSIIDADQLAKKSVEKGTSTLKEMVQTFGREILDQNDCLDRAKLASIVFQDKSQLEKLNQIIQPVIRALFFKKVAYLESLQLEKPIFFDAPLLFERELEKLMDGTIVVFCKDEIAIERLQKYRNISKQDYFSRKQFQLPVETKKAKATWLIENNGTLQELETATLTILQEITLSIENHESHIK